MHSCPTCHSPLRVQIERRITGTVPPDALPAVDELFRCATSLAKSAPSISREALHDMVAIVQQMAAELCDSLKEAPADAT